MPDNEHPETSDREAAQDARDPPEVTPEGTSFPIVGMGASAGGLEAFNRFFDHMPADSGMAFVLIMHLTPDRESKVVELVERHTEMPIHAAQDGMRVVPDNVYVIQPNTTLTIWDGVLHVTEPAAPRGQRTPIDEFFCSLAEAQGRNAVCIVLSGTGSDGTRGLRAIKELGGVTMTQAEARYQDMPHSAHATGLGDYNLPVEDMPARLRDYAAHISQVDNEQLVERLRSNGREQLGRILAMLHSHTGHDFSHYKETTIIRRVERRLQVTQSASPDEYVEHLRNSPEELSLLFGDMLIGVTQFMRDREVFTSLASQVVPELCAQKGKDESARIWAPGCATGEEAYSLAILFLQEMARGECDLRLQVFATDIDVKALEAARAGIYPESIASHLSAEQLQQFFRKHDHGYQVAKQLREPCIFSKHDLIKDPPFSRLDMISCRNVLIYMTPTLQKRLIPVFHYALRPGGVLLLGPSETITGFEELFETVDRKQRIFRRRDAQVTPRFEFPLAGHGVSFAPQEAATSELQFNRENSISRQTERYLLDQYAPSCVVVNRRYEAVYFCGSAGQYLEPPPGAPDHGILNMARHGLRTQLRAALDEAVREQQPAVREDVHVKTNGDYQTVRLKVRPIVRHGGHTDYYAVIFEPADAEQHAPRRRESRKTLSEQQEKTLVRQLEDELHSTRRHLQTTIEDLESSNEELKSANEELMSTNEEMQSTTEELDTSKEELQSVNEELTFANEELRRNNEQLARANSDIRNLFDNTQIAVMFLDKQLNIRSLTPRMSDLYHLRTSDTGRSIADIRAKHDYAELETDVARVLETLIPVERNLRTVDGEFMLRILPYQTLDSHIDGVVVTFFDITNLTRARAEIARLTEIQARRAKELNAMLTIVPVGVAICDDIESGRVQLNVKGAEILGVAKDADISWHGEPALFTMYRDGRPLADEERPFQRVLREGRPVHAEQLCVKLKDGSSRDIEQSAWPVFDEDGEIAGVVSMFNDVTARKREFELWRAQQTALAELGLFAMSESDMSLVQRHVIESLCKVLDTSLCEVWRLVPAQDELSLAASAGAMGGELEQYVVAADTGNLIGYTLTSPQPVVVRDAKAETRFAYPAHLADHGMVSSLSVAVKSADALWGVLGIHDHRPRQFLPYDMNFLQSVADLLGGVLRRKQLEIGHGQAERRQALAEAEDRMRQAERLASLGTLAAGIAHEVNNPLNSILMNAELGLVSLQSARARDKLPRLLDRIIKEAKRGGAITRSVLQFSKADHFTPKGYADLNSLIMRARDHVALVLHEHKVDLDLELAPTLPRLELNQIAMEQAMVNLINNAAQSGATRVGIRTERETHHARVTISDDGRGIPEAEIQHIFDPFYTTRRSQGGSGLGLSLVHRIIADHDGTVEARSAPSEGTQFILRLPLAETDA